MKECPYCKTHFTPHVKVGKRQKTCGKPVCKNFMGFLFLLIKGSPENSIAYIDKFGRCLEGQDMLLSHFLKRYHSPYVDKQQNV